MAAASSFPPCSHSVNRPVLPPRCTTGRSRS
jgi:hypothetical protein